MSEEGSPWPIDIRKKPADMTKERNTKGQCVISTFMLKKEEETVCKELTHALMKWMMRCQAYVCK